MASKRDFKKAIQAACGSIAGECIFAQTVQEDKQEQWDDVIIEAAKLQQEALKRVNAHFGDKVKSYGNRKEYNKARHAFFKQNEKSLAEFFRGRLDQIVARMNELMPGKKA